MKKLRIMILLIFVALVSVACQDGLTTLQETTSITTVESTTETHTDILTTEINTTEFVTEVPTTNEPTTLAPTTIEPTTEVPTTEAPTTEAPTTELAYDERGLVPEECEILDNIGDWQPVWCDEFNVDGLPDSSKWLYDVGGGGWGNNELQYYTNADIDNAYIEDGSLHIKAIKETYGTNEYTSARLVSKWQGDWLYGRIQVRAKAPEAARGTWSAIWMLPTDWEYGGWPYSGEIDIMEHVGYEPNEVHGTVHTGAYNHSLGTQRGSTFSLATAEEEFHIYEIEWEPSVMRFYVDGNLYFTYGYNPDLNKDIENSDAWPFDKRFHLILNLAIGGNWGGVEGVDNSMFPHIFEIDYVRVYQKDYAGMDQEAPTKPTSLVLQDTTYDSIRFKWNHGTDDVMIKEYEIFVNSRLEEVTTLNGIRINDLEPNTTYVIDIQSVDFAGNRSDFAQITVTTDDVPAFLGVIQAEDYDEASGVQKEQSEDTDGTQNVGWIDDGDYMIYQLRVEESGTYQIIFRVASESSGGVIKMTSKSPYPHFTLEFDATGGWQIWEDVTSSTFNLNAGVFSFKILAEQGGFNLNYFEVLKVE